MMPMATYCRMEFIVSKYPLYMRKKAMIEKMQSLDIFLIPMNIRRMVTKDTNISHV